jgi:pimeloyl-ACP methyl ester carboxylesterase
MTYPKRRSIGNGKTFVRSYRRLAAAVSDTACCHLINFVQWQLPDRTNSPAELADYLIRCRSLTRQEFYPKEPAPALAIERGLLSWSSPVKSEFSENNIARARLFTTSRGWSSPTVFFLHALMSASDFGYRRIAHRFNKNGWNAVLVHLPFHYTRVPVGYFNGALALTSNLIRNAETIRQALMEMRQLLELFRSRGAERFGLIGTSFGGWIGSLLLTLEPDFEFAVLLQPLVDMEDCIWRSPAAATIRSRLRRHRVEPGVSRPHAHLSSPLHGRPLMDPKRIWVVAGEYDRIAPVSTLRTLADTWNLKDIQIVPQGHFGYIAMGTALRRVLD